MKQEEVKNEYLEQVKAQQQKIELDLKANYLPLHAAADSFGAAAPQAMRSRAAAAGDENLSPAVNVRITGFWRWKTVVVPPNAYVVHTRRGHDLPLHLGLGVSFRFNPYSDSFLVVPSTMQTILINAYCICREMQGLLVQGYVQWIIADFSTAYKKLDFSDAIDPMRVVNVQLREQAEAAIKDKVATMSIDDVLSDKQPIIQELTARLRQVAEGEGDSDKGLGLRIVTVQVKEAVVSSTRLWENLQKPFRSERARVARLAELAAESVVKAQELEHEKARATAQIESDSEIAGLRAAKEAQAFDRENSESIRRLAKEVDAAEAAANLERIRIEKESELARLRLSEELESKETKTKAELALKEAAYAVSNRQVQNDIEFESARQKIHNDTSPASLQARLVDALPEVVKNLPKPNELRSISIANSHDNQGLTSIITQILSLLDSFRSGIGTQEGGTKEQ